ncbi:MAG: FAD:protein FMN transferase [Rhodospirillales bacterium]|nr:FAD:protein FMN transferase [Rhodospirillales bacterium]
MRQTQILMGMPITVEVVDGAAASLIDAAFAYFAAVERRFSVFRPDSEISGLNDGRIAEDAVSAEMREVLRIAERTRRDTCGYFDIRRPDGRLDPSGIVKGWAIRNAARMIASGGAGNFLVDAGGDIQSQGRAANGEEWCIGIRNPFNEAETIKAIRPRGRGVATSGTYVRGQHIYDPHRPARPIEDIVSLTVIGADVLEADRLATAAFAMGQDGIYFIEEFAGLEGYVIGADGVATQTSGFKDYVVT